MHLLLVTTCGNDEQKQPRNVVILGLDPGTQGVFNLHAKDSKLLGRGFSMVSEKDQESGGRRRVCFGMRRVF